MKRFLFFALCAMVSLAGCQKIDETDSTPETKESTLKVTAVIVDNSTKVAYDVTDNKIKPKWAVGDKIFGFTDGGTFTFEVTEVNSSGKATFSNGGFAPEDGTTLYAVYYPAKGASDFANGELAVDVTSQSGSLDGTAPAIMCATATVEDGNVLFSFENQTAIIGVKKFQTNPDELITTFKASGLVATGTIELVGGEIKLVPDTKTSDITISCEYTADTEGMYEEPVYFIALPTEDAAIALEATSSKGQGQGTYTTLTKAEAGNIVAGEYCYMSKKLSSDHIARYTNNGGANWTYTESLANAISGIATTTAKEDGIVELLKDYTISEQITFSSKKFTLEGNGHTINVTALSNDIKASITPLDASDITFKNVTIKGPGTSSNYRAIAVAAQSTVTLGDGCVICDFISAQNGGAVSSEGTLIMTANSKITNCSAPAGGALWFTASSKGTITGATITGCTATSGNAGCMLINGSNVKVDMKDCTISDCTCPTAGYYGGAFRVTSGTLNVTGGTIKNCVANYGGGVSTSGGTVNLSGVSISGCAVNNGGSGGTFYLTGGTINVKNNSVITGTNAYITTAGELNIDNSTYNYTGTGTALFVAGTSSTANAGVIKITNSLIKSTGVDINAKWGTVTCTDSDFISAGDYGVFFNDGAIMTFTSCRGVNTNSGTTASVFYSNTVNMSGYLKVMSGYYSGNYIAARLSSLDANTLCRIYVFQGCYSRTNKTAATVAYGKNDITYANKLNTLWSDPLNPPVTQIIDGTEYTFNYRVL